MPSFGAGVFRASEPLLSHAGFEPNIDQTDRVNATIIAAIYGTPVIGSAVCIVLLNFYTLTHSSQNEAIANAGLDDGGG